MDPIARRFMWDIISRMTTTDRECSVILTTHSMEEAESLCNNIGIMVRRAVASYRIFFFIGLSLLSLLWMQG